MRRTAAAVLTSLVLASCAGGEPPAGRVIRFSTDDGVELVGEVRGSGDAGVVLAHMFPADRASWSDFASLLADEGFVALNFDFRGYGDSGGEKDIPEIWRDVVAAIAEIRDRGVRRVFVVGASMGGTASLIAASREELEGVVTLSAASTFMGLSAGPEVMQAVDEPKLFIAAEGDTSAAATAQRLYTEASGAKEVRVVTGDEHGTDLLDGQQAELVRRAILDFLRTS